MIEVFKTDVFERHQAEMLLRLLHQQYPAMQANFDLSDCDKILRVQSHDGPIPSDRIIQLLRQAGTKAEILPDEPPPAPIATLLDSQYN